MRNLFDDYLNRLFIFIYYWNDLLLL